MIVAIVTFPGSNCDFDCWHAVRLVGGQPRYVDHRATELGPVDAVILPGGFSYGDYLRAGAIASRAPIMAAVRAFAAAGGPVLGICNGFQILCEAGLLPGALVRNRSLKFRSAWVHLRVESAAPPFFSAYAPGQVVRWPIAHGDGCYVAPPEELARLEGEGQVVLRYCDPTGRRTPASNPNGSVHDIAGIRNARGNVVGVMPHPERAVEALLGGDDGRGVFLSLRDATTRALATTGGAHA